MRERIEVDSDLGPKDRIAIGSAIIDHIVERTLDGNDKNGKPFPEYSDDYVKTPEAKAAGKTKASIVNLKRTFEMLNSIKILRHGKGFINIGFERNDLRNNPIAQGHITGKYGKNKNKKKRDFLGLEDSKLDEIISQHREIRKDTTKVKDILAASATLLSESLKESNNRKRSK